VQLELANLLAAQLFWRLAEVFRKLLDGKNLAASRFRRIVAALEFIQHPLAK
jgi:hypothetical protein